MTDSAISKLSICQAACVLIGDTPLTSFAQQSSASIAGNTLYEDVVRDALTECRFRFATVQAPLGAPLTDVPLGIWDYAYSLPQVPEVLAVQAVYNNADNPEPFDRFDQRIYTNASALDGAYMHYTYRAPEDLWPPSFVRAIQFELAAVFAVPVTNDDGIAKYFEGKAERAWSKARTKLSQEQTARRPPVMGRLARLTRR